ncbi:MAG: DUF4433 domain-containing protein [Verrucomicrobiota bacterium]
MALEINEKRARIFRVTHIDNVRWILANGLHAQNSPMSDPKFERIGNQDLIVKRGARAVPVAPGGILPDYVPFYFTPHSMMLLNIRTGYSGVKQIANEDLVFCVSSIHALQKKGRAFVFSDRHAYLKTARFFNSVDDLGEIDWAVLQARDFKRDPDNPEKTDRYQAEALVHETLAAEDISGIVCYDENIKGTLDVMIAKMGLTTKTAARPTWYFR